MLDVETGGIRRLINQVYLSDIIIDTTNLLAREVVTKILDFIKVAGKLKSQRKLAIMEGIEKGTFPKEIIMGCVNMTNSDRLNQINWELDSIKNTADIDEKMDQLKDVYYFLQSVLKSNPWEKSLWARLYLSTITKTDSYVFHGLCHLIDALDMDILKRNGNDADLEMKLAQVADEVIKQLNLSPSEQDNLMRHLVVAVDAVQSSAYIPE
jgi:hypothetical protein